MAVGPFVGSSSLLGIMRREREREGDNTLHACKIDLRETGQAGTN